MKISGTFFYRPPLVAVSENLRDVCSTIFPLQLKLCHHLIYFHSYSFAPCMAKMSLNIFFSNVSMRKFSHYVFLSVASILYTSYRKKCIMRKLSWNSEKLCSRPEEFCNGKRRSWKFHKIPLFESHFLLKLQTEQLQLYWKEASVKEVFPVNFAKFPRTSLLQKPLDDCFWKWPKRAFSILGKIFKMFLFQTDPGYILILATILQKVPQKVIASHNLIVIWQHFTFLFLFLIIKLHNH